MRSYLLSAVLTATCYVFMSICVQAQSIIPSGSCVSPQIHKEWRELSQQEQQAYLAAVQCLRQTPSRLAKINTPTSDHHVPSTSVYNDLVWVHMQVMNSAHMTAAFLPWHRLFLAVHDNIIRVDCKYSGPLPYWDWSVDSQAPELSPIWNSNAFGGNGNIDTRCISTGLIAQTRAQFPTSHCIYRQWRLGPQEFEGQQGGDMLGAFYSPLAIQFILQISQSYAAFRLALEDHPHNLIHSAIGGDMSGTTTSTNDPVFFLHHRNLDRLWSIWQDRYPDLALTYSGNLNSSTPDANDATVDDTMDMFGLAENDSVLQLLNIKNGGAHGRMCYQYSPSVAPNPIPTPTVSDGKSMAIPISSGISTQGDTGIGSTDSNTGPSLQKRRLQKRKPLHELLDKATSRWPKGGNETTSDEIVSGHRVALHGSPFNPVTPTAYDRADYYNLRAVDPLPKEFLQAWMHTDRDIARIRKSETQIQRFIDFVNAANGFVSDYCLGGYMQSFQSGWSSAGVLHDASRDIAEQLLVRDAAKIIGSLDRFND
ncbi:hypothetical protein BDV3_003432 [Batrachochytrium dendrobatidis]